MTTGYASVYTVASSTVQIVQSTAILEVWCMKRSIIEDLPCDAWDGQDAGLHYSHPSRFETHARVRGMLQLSLSACNGDLSIL
jgi:hypothetical protein